MSDFIDLRKVHITRRIEQPVEDKTEYGLEPDEQPFYEEKPEVKP
jgi:hypothetical protein